MFKRVSSRLGRNSAFCESLRLSLSFSLLLCVQLAHSPNAQALTLHAPPIQSPPQQSAGAQSAPEVTTLELGKPVERELAGGQGHSYKIALREGQFLKVEIKPSGVGIGVSIQSPDGKTTQYFDTPGMVAEPVIRLVAEVAGVYQFNIYTTAKAAPGRYEIRIAELRPANADERELEQANKLMREYFPLGRSGRSAEGRTLLTRALEIRERVLGPDNVLVANTLAFLATNYSSTGEYASAEPLILRSLKIKEKALGADSPEVAHDLNQLGGLYLNKGDYLKAQEFDERALDIFERKQMAESVAAAEVLASLGDSYHAAGDYQNAEKYYQRSRAVLEKILGLDSFHLTSSYTSLGLVAYDAGDYPKAEAMFGRALTLGEKALGADSPTITKYLNNLATVYCTTDDYAKGEALYRRALANHEQKAAMSNPAAQETLFGLARCLAAQERTSEAVQVQTRASEIEERYVSVNLAAGSEREKLAFLANLSSRLSRNISLHTRLAPNDPAARDLSVTTILQRKGRAQDAMSASLSALRGRSGAEDRKLLDQLDDATTKLAQLVLGGAQKLTPAEYQEQIKALEEQREELEAEISRRSAGFYERTQPVTLAAVQAAIPEHAALIEFAVYRPFDPKAPDNQKAYGEPHYVAYVLRRQGEVQWVELGAAQELEARVTAWRQALRDPQRRDVRQLARAVDERLMQPLRALAGDATQLLVSPDGELNLIPFEALVDEQENYLVQRYAVTYLTSGRDLLRIQVARESRSQPLVIADPSFGEPAAQQIVKTKVATRATAPGLRRRSVTAARSLSEVYFAPLRGTAQEARAIKTLFPEANLLTGERATKAALKQATAPSILHIATHGFFLQDSDRASARAVQMAARGAGANAQIENPLLRSGLALAGANLRGGGGSGGGSDDGILTALEASSLNLWGTKLVVLSACDTGLGEVHNGEGVYGLRRAFVLAGAESLVMSLWPASDYSAETLMTNYYTNLSRGLGRGESLRQVQLSMLKRDRQLHPFYWANFIQSGAWTELRQAPRDSHVAPRPHGVD